MMQNGSINTVLASEHVFRGSWCLIKHWGSRCDCTAFGTHMKLVDAICIVTVKDTGERIIRLNEFDEDEQNCKSCPYCSDHHQESDGCGSTTTFIERVNECDRDGVYEKYSDGSTLSYICTCFDEEEDVANTAGLTGAGTLTGTARVECRTVSTVTEEAKTANNKACDLLAKKPVDIAASEIDDVATSLASVVTYDRLHWHLVHANSTLQEDVFKAAMLRKVTPDMEYISPSKEQKYGSYVKDDSDPFLLSKAPRVMKGSEGLKDLAALAILAFSVWGFISMMLLLVFHIIS